MWLLVACSLIMAHACLAYQKVNKKEEKTEEKR